MLRNLLLALFGLFLVIGMLPNCEACDHNDMDDGSGEIREDDFIDCRSTMVEDEDEANHKFQASGGAVQLTYSADMVILNSTTNPSRTGKWRIQKCSNTNIVAMLVWGEITQVENSLDFLQIHRSIFRGTSKCFGYAKELRFAKGKQKSVLIGLHNPSSQSSFKVAAICASTSVFQLIGSGFFQCNEVLEYVKDSEERLVQFKEILTASSTELVSYLNNGSDNIHKCNILNRYARHCRGPYRGPTECESS